MVGFLCLIMEESLPPILGQFLCRQRRSCGGKCSLLQVTGSFQCICNASLWHKLSSNTICKHTSCLPELTELIGSVVLGTIKQGCFFGS